MYFCHQKPSSSPPVSIELWGWSPGRTFLRSVPWNLFVYNCKLRHVRLVHRFSCYLPPIPRCNIVVCVVLYLMLLLSNTGNYCMLCASVDRAHGIVVIAAIETRRKSCIYVFLAAYFMHRWLIQRSSGLSSNQLLRICFKRESNKVLEFSAQSKICPKAT